MLSSFPFLLSFVLCLLFSFVEFIIHNHPGFVNTFFQKILNFFNFYFLLTFFYFSLLFYLIFILNLSKYSRLLQIYSMSFLIFRIFARKKKWHLTHSVRLMPFFQTSFQKERFSEVKKTISGPYDLRSSLSRIYHRWL